MPYNEKISKIGKQLNTWGKISRLAIIGFVIFALVVLPFHLVLFKHVFFIGALVVLLLALAWSVWTLFHLKTLVGAIGNTAENIDIVNQEFAEIKESIKDIKDNHEALEEKIEES